MLRACGTSRRLMPARLLRSYSHPPFHRQRTSSSLLVTAYVFDKYFFDVFRALYMSHTQEEEKNRVATNNYEEVSLLIVCIGTSSGSPSRDPRGNSRAIEDSLFRVSEV